MTHGSQSFAEHFTLRNIYVFYDNSKNDNLQ